MQLLNAQASFENSSLAASQSGSEALDSCGIIKRFPNGNSGANENRGAECEASEGWTDDCVNFTRRILHPSLALRANKNCVGTCEMAS